MTSAARLAVLLAYICSGAPALADAVPAIWRTQHLDLRVMSTRTQFRCEEFALRLQAILAAVGATLEPNSELHCPESFSSTLRGRLVVKSPFVADESNLAQASAAITSSDRLLARLKGAAAPETLIRSFPANWQAVSTSTHPSLRRLDSGDCELLRAVVLQLLPRMSVREAKFRRSCHAGGEPRFSAIALVSESSEASAP